MNFFTLLSDINTKEINIKLNEDGTITIATVQAKQEIPEAVIPETIFNKVEHPLTPAEAVEKVEDEISPTKEEPTPIVEKEKPVKEAKVNNEKPLKEFMAIVRLEPSLLPHKDKIEELYANLSEAELDKPFAKKVRMDLDIAIRKQQNIDAARAKLYAPKVTEETAEATGKDGAEEEQSLENQAIEELVEESITEEEIAQAEEIINDIEVTQEETLEPTPVITLVPTPIPTPVEEVLVPMPIPLPPTPPTPAPVFEIVEELEMIAEDYTLEQYTLAGWSEQMLIDSGRAKIVKRKVEVTIMPLAQDPAPMPTPPVPTPAKVGYTFPKHFDEPEEESDDEDYNDYEDNGGTGHGDISHSDADSGL